MSSDDITEIGPKDAEPDGGPKIGPPGIRGGRSSSGMMGGAAGRGQEASRGSWGRGYGGGYLAGRGDAGGERLTVSYRGEDSRGGYSRMRPSESPYGGYVYGGSGYGGSGAGGYGGSSYGGSVYGGYGTGMGGGYRSGGYGSSASGGMGWIERERGSGEHRGRGGYGGYGTWREAVGGAETGRGSGSMAHGRGSDRVRAERLMTEDPRTVAEDATLVEAAEVLVHHDVDAVPVVGGRTGRTLRGMLTARDVVRAVARRLPPETPVSEVMDASAAAIYRFDGIDEMRAVLRRSGAGRLPVVDRERRLVGIVARADLEAWDVNDRW